MNKDELKQRLEEEKVPSWMYCLEGGGLPNEAYVLVQNGSKWEVYYSERGEKSNLKSFDTEEEACDYLYEDLTDTLEIMGLR